MGSCVHSLTLCFWNTGIAVWKDSPLDHWELTLNNNEAFIENTKKYESKREQLKLLHWLPAEHRLYKYWFKAYHDSNLPQKCKIFGVNIKTHIAIYPTLPSETALTNWKYGNKTCCHIDVHSIGHSVVHLMPPVVRQIYEL